MLTIKRLHPTARLPTRGTPNSIGLDIYAHAITETGRENTILIPPRVTRSISTGLVVVPPEGWAVFVCSRSGLALRSIFVTNSPGVVDPDYRGELQILLYNGHHESYYVKHGDRVAQVVLLQIAPSLEVVETDAPLPPTVRGEAGFGSTGR